MQYTTKQLSKILAEHAEWVEDSGKGKRADLGGANLHGTDLHGTDLSYADLSYANLHGADLCGADLSGANLSGATVLDKSGRSRKVYTMDLPQHRIIVLGYDKEAEGDMVRIGCEQHTLQHCLDNYTAIGEEAGYSVADTRLYINVLKALFKLIRRGE